MNGSMKPSKCTQARENNTVHGGVPMYSCGITPYYEWICPHTECTEPTTKDLYTKRMRVHTTVYVLGYFEIRWLFLESATLFLVT